MEIRSFLSGIFFMVALMLLLPLLGVKISVSIPFAPASTFLLGIVCVIISYYLFRN